MENTDENAQLKLCIKKTEQKCRLLRHRIDEFRKERENQTTDLNKLKHKHSEKKTEILLAEHKIECIKKVFADNLCVKNKEKDILTDFQNKVFENREEFTKRVKQYTNNLEKREGKEDNEDEIKRKEHEYRDKYKEILKLEGKIKAMKLYLTSCNNKDIRNKVNTTQGKEMNEEKLVYKLMK